MTVTTAERISAFNDAHEQYTNEGGMNLTTIQANIDYYKAVGDTASVQAWSSLSIVHLIQAGYMS